MVFTYKINSNGAYVTFQICVVLMEIQAKHSAPFTEDNFNYIKLYSDSFPLQSEKIQVKFHSYKISNIEAP